MGRHKLFHYEPKLVRDSLRALENKANEMHALESDFIIMLAEIDRYRFFVRFGYRSLRTYMIESLRMSKTQAQMIIIKMRSLQGRAIEGRHHEISHSLGISESSRRDYRGSFKRPQR